MYRLPIASCEERYGCGSERVVVPCSLEARFPVAARLLSLATCEHVDGQLPMGSDELVSLRCIPVLDYGHHGAVG